MDSQFEGDQTMRYLYTLAAGYEKEHHNNITLPLLESQSQEYERLLSLAHSLGSPDVLIQAINEAKTRNNNLKSKDDGALAAALVATNTNTNTNNNNDNDNDQSSSSRNNLYKQGIST